MPGPLSLIQLMMQNPQIASLVGNGGSGAASSLLASGVGAGAPAIGTGPGSLAVPGYPAQTAPTPTQAAPAAAPAASPMGGAPMGSQMGAPAPTAAPAAAQAPTGQSSGSLWSNSPQDTFLKNVVGFEDPTGNPTAQNPSSSAFGLGQVTQANRAAFLSSPAGKGLTAQSLADPANQAKLMRWQDGQNSAQLAANGVTTPSPAIKYGAWLLGPMGALAVSKASPTTPLATALSSVYSPADLKQVFAKNASIISPNMTVGSALANFSAVGTGNYKSISSTGGAPTAPAPAPGAAPAPGQATESGSELGLINNIMGQVPGAPNLATHLPGSLAHNELLNMGLGFLSGDGKENGIARAAQGFQQAREQEVTLGNTAKQTMYQDAMNKAKIGANLAMLSGKRTMLGYMPIQNAQGQWVYPTTDGFGQVHTINMGSATPLQMAEKGAQGDQSRMTDTFKGQNALYTADQSDIPNLSKEIQDNNNYISVLSDPKSMAAVGPGVIKNYERQLVQSFPGLSGMLQMTPSGIQLTENIQAQLREGSLQPLKKIFGARVSNYDAKLLNGLATSIRTAPNTASALMKALNQEKQIDLQTKQEVNDVLSSMPDNQRQQFLSSPGAYQNLSNSIFQRRFGHVFGSVTNPQADVSTENGQPVSNVGQTNTQLAPTPAAPVASAAAKTKINQRPSLSQIFGK